MGEPNYGEWTESLALCTLCYELGDDKNPPTTRKTLYALRFADFLVHIARGKLTKFPPAIVPIPERTRENQPQNFLFSIIVAVGPIRYRLRLYTVPTAVVKILAGTFPLSADPGEVFFIISILKQSSRYRRRQRVGTLFIWGAL
jgi:hypothetical protein